MDEKACFLGGLTIDDLARDRKAYVPQGEYDHSTQQLGHWKGPYNSSTTASDEDAGGSTTFWDGESS